MLKALIIQFSFIALGVIFAWSMFRAPSMSSSSNLIFDEVLFLSVMDTSLDESETDLSAYVWRGTLIYCLIYRLILDLMHRYIKDAVSHGRANIRSASQYTFMIMNVPEDLRVSQEHAFVQEILKERYPYAQIVGFTFAYDLEKHMKMTTDYIWYKSELNRMRCRKELSGSEAPRYFRCCYSGTHLYERG